MDLQSIDNLKVKDALFDLFPEEKAKLLDEKAEALFPMLIPYFDEYYNNFVTQIDAAQTAIEDVALSGNARTEDAFNKISELNNSFTKLQSFVDTVMTLIQEKESQLKKEIQEGDTKQQYAIEKEEQQRIVGLEALQNKVRLTIEELKKSVVTAQDKHTKHSKITKDELEEIRKTVKKEIANIHTKMSTLGGGSMNRNIAVNGNASVLSRYTDINLKAGSNMTLSVANNNTTKMTEITFASSGSGGTGYQAATGTVNGSNTVFTFSLAPNVVCVDQSRVMQATSSDGTINWTGTTTITLTVAPNFDIFGVA